MYFEMRREGTTYTAQTLGLLKEQYPDTEFYFIIGADSLFAIETWVHPERIFPACVILAACRDDHDSLEEMKAQVGHLKTVYPKARIQLLRSPLIPVSSSEIRRKIRAGLSIAEEVPGEVEAYIKEEELYEP